MKPSHWKRLLIASLAVLCTVVLSGNLAAPASADDPAVPRLHREGRFLVDQYGRTVIVHGLNFVWKKAPYVPPDSPNGFTAADAQWLYDHGFNGARLGILWAGVDPTAPGVVDTSYFDKWQRVIDLMAGKGIWMQFDMHQDQWNEVYGGEGVPAWAVKRPLPWSLLPYPSVPFPEGYWTPEVSTVFDNFWANKDHLLDSWATFWKQVASHYKNQPYSMGYDLINEPWVGQEWPGCFVGCWSSYVNELQPAQNKALAGIRTVDANNIVWYEPQQLAGGLMVPTYLSSVPGENNLGLSWHNYCSATFAASLGLPLDFTESCTGFTANREDNAISQAATMNAAPLMSEWGATDNARALQIDADSADANDMSWLYWAYKYWNDPTTADTHQGLFVNDADLSNPKPKLSQLVRTYPQATAGHNLAYSYDTSTGLFRMTFTSDPNIVAPTHIFVSPLTAPHGYTVTTSAGTVTKNGSYVDLANTGSGTVNVTITPLP